MCIYELTVTALENLKKMNQKLILIVNIIILILSVLWFIKSPDFEPSIVILSSIVALATFTVTNQRTPILQNRKRAFFIYLLVPILISIICIIIFRMRVEGTIGIKGNNNDFNNIEI